MQEDRRLPGGLSREVSLDWSTAQWNLRPGPRVSNCFRLRAATFPTTISVSLGIRMLHCSAHPGFPENRPAPFNKLFIGLHTLLNVRAGNRMVLALKGFIGLYNPRGNTNIVSGELGKSAFQTFFGATLSKTCGLHSSLMHLYSNTWNSIFSSGPFCFYLVL